MCNIRAISVQYPRNICAISVQLTVQYLCQSDESHIADKPVSPTAAGMMTVTIAVSPPSLHQLCKICATHVPISKLYLDNTYLVPCTCTCANIRVNIRARMTRSRVAVKPLPLQIRRESSYLPTHTPPMPPFMRRLQGVTCPRETWFWCKGF